VKRLLADVNVVLDAVLERGPRSDAAAKLWMAAEKRRVEALVPAHGVTTLFHLLAREKGAPFARRIVGSVVATFGIAAVDRVVIGRALALAWPDFEDAVGAAAAEAAGCEAIVTRDPKGFPECSIPVLSPETAIALLEGGPPDRAAEAPAAAYGARSGSRPGPRGRTGRRKARS
jgi:predicted nucleic acid-binding protein